MYFKLLLFLSLLLLCLVIYYFSIRKTNLNTMNRYAETFNMGEHILVASGDPNLEQGALSYEYVNVKETNKVDIWNCSKDSLYIIKGRTTAKTPGETVWAITDIKLTQHPLDSDIPLGWSYLGLNIPTQPTLTCYPEQVNKDTGPAIYMGVKYSFINSVSETRVIKDVRVINTTKNEQKLPSERVIGKISGGGKCDNFDLVVYENFIPFGDNTYLYSIMLTSNKGYEVQLRKRKIGTQSARKFRGLTSVEGFQFNPEGVTPLNLSFGDIIGLAGDCLALLEYPISFDSILNPAYDIEKEISNFNDYFTKTLYTPIEPFRSWLPDIAKEVIQSKAELVNAIQQRIQGISYYSKNSERINCACNRISGGSGNSYATMAVFKGYYTKLAAVNFDHFCDNNRAFRAYQAGHISALRTANEAKDMPVGDDRMKKINEAIAREAFSCHYLTDHFAGGHIRQPSTYFIGPSRVGIKVGHDEDCRYGIWVRNNWCYDPSPTVPPYKKRMWKAYGDSFFSEPENSENRDFMLETIEESVSDILQVVNNLKTYDQAIIDIKLIWNNLPNLDNRKDLVPSNSNIPLYGKYKGKNLVIDYCSPNNLFPMLIAYSRYKVKEQDAPVIPPPEGTIFIRNPRDMKDRNYRLINALSTIKFIKEFLFKKYVPLPPAPNMDEDFDKAKACCSLDERLPGSLDSYDFSLCDGDLGVQFPPLCGSDNFFLDNGDPTSSENNPRQECKSDDDCKANLVFTVCNENQCVQGTGDQTNIINNLYKKLKEENQTKRK